MKKIMLVDDEILTRDSIRNCVNWSNEGFIYCGDASDGEMALPFIEEWQPQILITDIKMPFMDGLELATIVRKKYPHIKIIILSGHDEFHYAQKAIRIGVEDYCLKPVGSKDLLELLHKASKKIDAEQQKKENEAYSKEKLLSDLCGGLINTSRALEIASSYSISIIARYYAVISIDLVMANDELEQIDAIRNVVEQQLIAYFPDGVETLHYIASRTELVYMLKSNDYDMLQSCLEDLPTQLQPLFAEHSCVGAIGIGSIQLRLQGVHQSFLEAKDNQNRQRLFLQNQQEVHNLLADTKNEQPIIHRNKFIEFVKIGTQAQLDSFIDAFCKDMELLSWSSSMYGVYLLNELTLEAFYTAKLHFPASFNYGEHQLTMQQQLKRVQNIEQCKQYLSSLLLLLWQWRALGSNQYSELIIKVKQYIAEHFHNNQLSLQDVSRHVGVSPSHLSKVFSQETRQTLTEFITQTRIQKAMELLKTTRYKTFEIAFEVGYQDQHYFSNIFKKVTGMTPMEYRKQDSFPAIDLLQQNAE